MPPSGMMDAQHEADRLRRRDARSCWPRTWGSSSSSCQTTGATRIPNLQTDKADIVISTLSVTPERAKVIDFTKRYAALQSVVGVPEDRWTVKGWADLKGKTDRRSPAAPRRTPPLSNMKDRGPHMSRAIDDDATMVTAAVSGQADCVGLVGDDRQPDRREEPGRECSSLKFSVDLRSRHRLKKGEPPPGGQAQRPGSPMNVKNGKLNAIYRKFHGVELPRTCGS